MSSIAPWICNCGRLHDITPEINERMLQGEEIVTKCKNCGTTVLRGLEETFDDMVETPDGKVYMSYAYVIDPVQLIKNSKFIFETSGTLVPMLCGHTATELANGSPICTDCCPEKERYVILARDRHPAYVVDKSKLPEYPFCDTGIAYRW